MTTARDQLGTDVPLTALTGDQLRARVARAQLYLIRMEPLDGWAGARPELHAEHARYLHKLEAEGRLYGCGPLDEATARPGTALAIVAAASRKEAELIALSEPFHRSGLRRNSVRGHTMNEGVACYVGRALARRMEALGESFDPHAGSLAPEAPVTGERPAGARLHLMSLEPGEKPRPPEDTQTGFDHFVWLRENEMRARLMSCGPVEPAAPLPPGVWGGGLAVVAGSREEVEAIAAAEPSGRAGYRKLSVAGWTLTHGLAAPIGRALEALSRLP